MDLPEQGKSTLANMPTKYLIMKVIEVISYRKKDIQIMKDRPKKWMTKNKMYD